MSLLKKISKKVNQVNNWREFIRQIRPTENFQPLPDSTQPDYSELANWAAHPHLQTKVHFTPEGIPVTDAWQNGAVDVFFLYPTVYFGNQTWNTPIENPQVTQIVNEVILTGQATVFNESCRIFAPKYRQATFYSFLGAKRNGRKALEFAYADCLAAFDYYIQHLNQGRPFFLAGHSQGALHLMRILEERIDRTDLKEKMVAAYPIGFWFPMDKFGSTLKNLQPANAATDLHSIVAYDTYLNTGRPRKLLDRVEVVYSMEGKPIWKKRIKKTPLGINPLNWERSTALLPATAHLGAVHLKIEGDTFTLMKNAFSGKSANINCIGLSKPFVEECSAQLGKDGVLYVSSPAHRAFKSQVLPGGNLHLFDYSLFYMNLRANVKTRWNAFQKKYTN
jgi:hypothetical protein